ncbi:arabinosyltransferase domain-containing protein [Actinomycetes bacterium KLBMP 9759]
MRVRVLVFGLVALLAAVAFPFAPVEQPEATYSWSAADGPAAIPLMPYQPARLEVRFGCADVRGAPATVFSTVPRVVDPAAAPLAGLSITARDGSVQVASAGVDLGAAPLPAGDCAATFTSDPGRTELAVDGVPVVEKAGDFRPDVAGAFSDVRSGVAASITTDTRFQTTISPLKLAVGTIALVALAGMLISLRRGERRVRLLPRGWWRPRPVDAAVAGALVVWWVVGSATVDDGYVAGIVRSRGTNGLVGNLYRWLNAPEAPFSWMYELYHLWSLVSSTAPWMRLPSTLLGLVCWWLLARAVLPRITRHRWAAWLGALAFTAWWVAFNLGLRPEPWVAVGVLAVYATVERAVATRRLLPLAFALVIAAATMAVTPGGLVAFAPLLASAVPLFRLLRAQRDLPLTIVLLAAPASALLLMTYDQSISAIVEAIRIRAVIGGGVQWYEEFERYAALLTPLDFQGALGRRAAVLFTLIAAAGALRRTPGIAYGPARRLVLTLLISLAALAFTPTKWTQHFGVLAGVGAAVLVLGLVAYARAHLGALAAVTATTAVVLSGANVWPYAANWFEPSFSTIPPRAFGVPLSTIVIAGGGAVVLWLAGREAWRRAGGAVGRDRMPAAGSVTAVVLVLALTLQVGGFVKVAVDHPDGYTPAAETMAALGGDPCGVQPLLSVETDPMAGLLSQRPGPRTADVVPVDVGGTSLPGVAATGTFGTAWFDLVPGGQPVVVTASGHSDAVAVEFAARDRPIGRRTLRIDSTEPRDIRVMPPAGADAVRLVANAPVTARPAVVSLPRVPRLTPMLDVLPPGSTAVLDWPVAFLFPCLTPAPLGPGSTALPRWRVAPPQSDDSAGITYSPDFGGPFAAARLLVTERRMATYLRGDPMRDAVQLRAWLPIAALAEPQPVVAGRGVAGTAFDGRPRVPGHDTPG